MSVPTPTEGLRWMFKRVYIAGPMRGYPDLNWPAFDKAKADLQALGYQVVSPADLDRAYNCQCDDSDQRPIVRRDIDALTTCDMVAVLPGFRDSIGTMAELAVARWLGLTVATVADVLAAAEGRQKKMSAQ